MAKAQKMTAQEMVDHIVAVYEYKDIFYDDLYRRTYAVHPTNREKRSKLYDEVYKGLKERGFWIHS